MKKTKDSNVIRKLNLWSKKDKERFKKQAQIVRELLENPKFQREIEEIRKKHEIPNNGFKKWNDYSSWDKKIEAKTVLKTIKWESIKLDLEGKPTIETKSYKKKVNSFHLDICSILKEHDLGFDWWSQLEGHITRNQKMRKIPIYDAILTRETCDNNITINELLQFEISSTLGIPNINKKWKGKTIWADQITPLQQLMQGHGEKKGRSIKRWKEGKTAYQMKKEGHSLEEIFDAINPDTESLNYVKEDNIRQIRKRYKKRTGND